MNRGLIRDNVRANLADAAITYYADPEINESIQDAYDEIVAKTMCHIKSVTYNWSVLNGNYIDFITDFGLTDYLGTYAIFNQQTNWWLRDDLSLRDLDRVRRDWEMWRGQPQFWIPHSLRFIIIAPINLPGSGQFTLWYYAIAPALVNDTSTPVIAADQHQLLEWYSTADLLESAEEIGKAGDIWTSYEVNLMEYKERCHNIAKTDLLLRI